jgi:hypothetical protein
MLAGMLARKLQKPEPDTHSLIKQVADMQEACKVAIATRTDIMGWFQPSETRSVPITTEASQCAHLLSAEFAIRGCSVDSQMAETPHHVRQHQLRTVIMATLFAVLDNAGGPVAVQLRFDAQGKGDATLTASWRQLPASDFPAPDVGKHAISWDDLQVITDQAGVGLERCPTLIDLHFTAETAA